MGDKLASVVSVAVALIGLATIAVLVSKNAQTPQVISSAAQGLAGNIEAAVSPVTGGGSSILGGSSFNFGGGANSIGYNF